MSENQNKFTVALSIEEFREGLTRAHEQTEALFNELSPEGKASIEASTKKAEDVIAGAIEEPGPPSYLPMQPHEAPRIPDLCPDDWQDEPCVCHEQSGPCRRCCQGVIPGSAPHNPETCHDPACDCMPF